MPTRQTVERFVELVEAGHGVAALEEFYGENASMQENQAVPRFGKPALVANETAAQAAVTCMTARCIRPILIEGDTVVLRWTFDYVDGRGRPVHFEELAYQRWAGECILEEQFFYDPGQFKPRA
ncbi:MAG: nuclear transport factor 2 family protein [Betaproteobacteria bacterium]